MPSPEASLSPFSQHGRWGSEMSVPRGLGRSHKSSYDLASRPLQSHGQTSDCSRPGCQGKGIRLPLLTKGVARNLWPYLVSSSTALMPFSPLISHLKSKTFLAMVVLGFHDIFYSPQVDLFCVYLFSIFSRGKEFSLLDGLESNEGVIRRNGVSFKAVIIHVALSQHSYIQ